MNGIVATEKEATIVKTIVPQAVSYSQVIKPSLRLWGSELTFLKRKYQLLERLVELNHTSSQSSLNKDKKEDLLRECSLFLRGSLSDFEHKYNKSRDLLTGFDSSSESLATERLRQFQRLQQAWNDLQIRSQQLEIKLLSSFVEKFPVVII